jgi:hypothetical protein
VAKSKKNTPKALVLDDESPGSVRDKFFFPEVDGETKGHGLVPRNFAVDPPEMFAPPSEVTIIPRVEWSERIKDQERNESSLKHLRLRGDGGAMVPSLDQGQVGYCWAHSTTHVVMLDRMKQNLPYVPLSAYAVAATIKKGRDEGGWCGLSAQFDKDRGIPSQARWPQCDRSYTKYDTPEVWASAAMHKVEEDWVDLAKPVYDRNLSWDMTATCLLSNIPCALDFNHWSHSVCGLNLVEVEPGSFGILIWNSWSDSWSDRGMGILRGSKAVPDGAVAFRVSTAAAG